MVSTPIPRWLAKLDEEKPYLDVLDGATQPDVSPYRPHGRLSVRIGAQLDEWAGEYGSVGAEVRFYFLRPDGKWSSLLPDIDYMSYARLPSSTDDESLRPRIAPDLAVEIVSPGDRPGRLRRKVEIYLEFGASVVMVVHPMKRRVALHRADRTVEERDARGAWALEPFDGLVLDWEKIYRGITLPGVSR